MGPGRDWRNRVSPCSRLAPDSETSCPSAFWNFRFGLGLLVFTHIIFFFFLAFNLICSSFHKFLKWNLGFLTWNFVSPDKHMIVEKNVNIPLVASIHFGMFILNLIQIFSHNCPCDSQFVRSRYSGFQLLKNFNVSFCYWLFWMFALQIIEYGRQE